MVLAVMALLLVGASSVESTTPTFSAVYNNTSSDAGDVRYEALTTANARVARSTSSAEPDDASYEKAAAASFTAFDPETTPAVSAAPSAATASARSVAESSRTPLAAIGGGVGSGVNSSSGLTPVVAGVIGQANSGYWIQHRSSKLVTDIGGSKWRMSFGDSHVTVETRDGAEEVGLASLGRGSTLRLLGGVKPAVETNRVEYTHPGVREVDENGPNGVEQTFEIFKAPRGSGTSVIVRLATSGPLHPEVDNGGDAVTFLDSAGSRELRYDHLAVRDATGRVLPARMSVTGHRIGIHIDVKDAVYPVSVDPYIQEGTVVPGNAGPSTPGFTDIAMSGNTMVVCDTLVFSSAVVHAFSVTPDESGAAYVLRPGVSGWGDPQVVATLRLPDGFSSIDGCSVAMSGSTIVLGESEPFASSGNAFVYTEPSGGWTDATPTATLSESDAGASNGDSFGQSVAIDGNTIAVGAPYAATEGQSPELGGVYIFEKPAGGWTDATEDARLYNGPTASDSDFGLGGQVALADGFVAATATRGGPVFEWTEPAGGWASESPTTYLTDSAGGAFYGSVAASDNTIAATAVEGTGYSQTEQQVDVFSEPSGGWADATETSTLHDSARGANADLSDANHGLVIADNTIFAASPEVTDQGVSDAGEVFSWVEPTGGWADLSTQTGEIEDLPAGFPGGAYSLAVDGRSVAVLGSLATVFHMIVPHSVASTRGGGRSPMARTARVCPKGDPVNCATGDFDEPQTDLSLPVPGGQLALTRTYDTQAAAAAGSAGMFGYGWSATYTDQLQIDPVDGVDTVVFANGSQVPFTITGSGLEPPPGEDGSLTANADGTYTLMFAGSQETYLFSSSGQLQSETDRYGDTTTLAYDGSGRLQTITAPGGRSITLSYNSDGTVSQSEDSAGRTVEYGYTNGDLTTVTDVRGGQVQFGYDSQNRMTSMTTPNGNVTTNTYDSQNRVIEQDQPGGRDWTWSYPYPDETEITDPDGNVEDEYFDADFDPTGVVQGVGSSDPATTLYAYDDNLNPSATTNPDGNTTSYSYDASGNELSETDPLGNTTSWTYNAGNQVTSSTTPSGETTTYTYTGGSLTNVSSAINGQTQQTTFSYTDARDPDAVTTSTDPDGHTTTYSYDSSGDLTSETDPDGHKTTYGYNAAGEQTSSTTANGNTTGADTSLYTTTSSYDAAGDLTGTSWSPSLQDSAAPGDQLGAYSIPTADAGADDLVSGSSGNLWFTASTAHAVGEIAPDGTVHEYAVDDSEQPPGYSYVQAHGTADDESDGTLSLCGCNGTPVSRNDLLVASITWQGSPSVANQTASLNDSLGDSFSQIRTDAFDSIHYIHHEYFYAYATSSGVDTLTATFHANFAYNYELQWVEYSGVSGAPVSVATSANQSAEASPYNTTTPTVTPTAPGQLVVSILQSENQDLPNNAEATPGTYPAASQRLKDEFSPAGTLDLADYAALSDIPTTPSWVLSGPGDGIYGISLVFALQPKPSGPAGLTVGADGNAWFADPGANAIGTATPSGAIIESTVPDAAADPTSIARGPNDTLRFTESGNSAIGTFDPSANGFDATISTTTAGSEPSSIVSDGHGDDYFLELNPSTNVEQIGEISSTGAITETPLKLGSAPDASANHGPGETAIENDKLWAVDAGNSEFAEMDLGTHSVTYIPYPSGVSSVNGLTAASDGAIWFTTQGTYQVGEIDPATGNISLNATTGSGGAGITQGPDGNIWAVDPTADKIYKLASGMATTDLFAAPSAWSTPRTIVSGSDNDVWFAEPSVGKIGEVTSDGTVSDYSTGAAGATPDGLTVGAGGDVWFADPGTNSIGYITSSGSVSLHALPETDAEPTSIARGPSGTLRFTESGNSAIGTFDPLTGDFGRTVSTPTTGSLPASIVSDGKGDDYFLEINPTTHVEQIGEINSSGTITETALKADSSPDPAANHGPGEAAIDNGVLWATDWGNSDFVEMDLTSGDVTYIPFPTGVTGVTALTAASDGMIWFTEQGSGSVGELDPSNGLISQYTTTAASGGGIVQGADGNIWTTDPAGNEIQRLSLAPVTTKSTYDADGNLTSSTDADGQTTTYAYDDADEPVSTTEPNGVRTSTTYDDDGNVTSQTDGRGKVTSYTYNALNQQTTSTDPDSNETQYSHDPAGNLLTVTDPESRVTTYTPNADGQTTSIDYSDGTTPSVEYTYNPDGTVQTMVDGTGTTTYTYDALDRLTSVQDGNGDTIGYEYDLAGNETSITYPGDLVLARTFDDEERLASVEDWLGNTTTFTYDPDGDQTTTSFPGSANQTDTYTYDNTDDPTGSTVDANGSQTASLAYTYDPDGNLTQQESTGLGDSNHAYAYTDLGQLAADNDQNNDYDPDGNLTQLGSSGTGSLTYDDADQLTQGPAGTYTYNPLGERTQVDGSGGTTYYSWDQAGDFTGVGTSDGTVNLGYGYDGNGLLQSSGNGTSTTQFTWDPNNDLPLLIAEGGTDFIYGPGDLPIEQIGTDGTPTFYHHDQLGSTVLLTSQAGTEIETVKYSAYGEPTITSGTASTPLLYGGAYTDPTTGFQYLQARWYDPGTGQFLSRDPLITATGQPFSYANDDPTVDTDPTGDTANDGPKLSGAEEGALEKEREGKPLTPAEKKLATSAKEKLKTQGKFGDTRNKGKQRGQPNKGKKGGKSNKMSVPTWTSPGLVITTGGTPLAQLLPYGIPTTPGGIVAEPVP